jgi:hypothetical protein
MGYAKYVLTAALLALVAAAPAEAAAPAASRAACSATAEGWKGRVSGTKIKPTRPAVEHRVVELVNEYRREHGLRALKIDHGLRYAARARGVLDERLSERLALYSPSECVAESVARAEGVRGAAAIFRTLRHDPESRHAVLLPWTRRIGVGVRIGTFKGEQVTNATADFSAARPKPPKPTSQQVRSKQHQAALKRKQKTPVASRPAPDKPAPSKPDPTHAKPDPAPAKPKPAPTKPPVVSPPPVPAPAPPPVLPPPAGAVVGVPYTCNGPVSNLRVVGTGSHSRSLVNLAAGCTGTISFDIHVTSGGGDGVKVQGGVHDLTIGPSRIVCDRLADTSFHQDGVQVQGGQDVTFNGLSIVCPYVTGQGAAGFYIDGKDFGGIRNVVCDGCNLEHWHYGAMFTGPAPGSGVRNSVIHQGGMTKGFFAKIGDILGMVDLNNTLAPHCDGAGIPC